MGLYGFIRGGNWNNGGNDGVLALNLNNGPGNTNSNIGFRVSRDNKKRPDIC
jgi:formylglycine-generating enzyme required for sulfatase activity